MAPYNASKWGVIGLTESQKLELEEMKIQKSARLLGPLLATARLGACSSTDSGLASGEGRTGGAYPGTGGGQSAGGIQASGESIGSGGVTGTVASTNYQSGGGSMGGGSPGGGGSSSTYAGGVGSCGGHGAFYCFGYITGSQ